MTIGGESPLPIERLCQHHDTAHFNCGESVFNESLREYQRRFIHGDEPSVFVATRGLSVEGYVAVIDLERKSPIGQTRRYIALPSFAVCSDHQGTDTAPRLLNRALDVARERQHRSAQYHGLLCTPHFNERVQSVLEHLHFRPLPDSDLFWWWRPFADLR